MVGPDVPFLLHREGLGLAGLDRGLEPVDLGRVLDRLLGAHQLELLVRAIRMLDQQRAVRLGTVDDLVGLLVGHLRHRRHDAPHRLHAGDLLRPGARLRIDFGSQVDGVAQEPLLVGLHIEHAGVPGVDAALEHGDRPLVQVRAAGVLEPQPEERVLALHGLVVDGEARALDVLAHDGQQRALLARQVHRVVDHVLEEVAELGRPWPRCRRYRC